MGGCIWIMISLLIISVLRRVCVSWRDCIFWIGRILRRGGRILCLCRLFMRRIRLMIRLGCRLRGWISLSKGMLLGLGQCIFRVPRTCRNIGVVCHSSGYQKIANSIAQTEAGSEENPQTNSPINAESNKTSSDNSLQNKNKPNQNSSNFGKPTLLSILKILISVSNIELMRLTIIYRWLIVL